MDRRGNEILDLNLKTIILFLFNVAVLVLIVVMAYKIIGYFSGSKEEAYRAQRNFELLVDRIEDVQRAKLTGSEASVVLSLPEGFIIDIGDRLKYIKDTGCTSDEDGQCVCLWDVRDTAGNWPGEDALKPGGPVQDDEFWKVISCKKVGYAQIIHNMRESGLSNNQQLIGPGVRRFSMFLTIEGGRELLTLTQESNFLDCSGEKDKTTPEYRNKLRFCHGMAKDKDGGHYAIVTRSAEFPDETLPEVRPGATGVEAKYVCFYCDQQEKLVCDITPVKYSDWVGTPCDSLATKRVYEEIGDQGGTSGH